MIGRDPPWAERPWQCPQSGITSGLSTMMDLRRLQRTHFLAIVQSPGLGMRCMYGHTVTSELGTQQANYGPRIENLFGPQRMITAAVGYLCNRREMR